MRHFHVEDAKGNLISQTLRVIAGLAMPKMIASKAGDLSLYGGERRQGKVANTRVKRSYAATSQKPRNFFAKT